MGKQNQPAKSGKLSKKGSKPKGSVRKKTPGGRSAPAGKTPPGREKTPGRKKTSGRKPTPLREQLKRAQAEIENLQDKLLRTAAELDNYRKRTEKTFSQRVEQANRDLILDILPVIDDLERSLKSTSEQGGREFREGIEMIRAKWLAILRNRGLEPMETVGQPFDVEKHDALLQMDREGIEPNIVLEEIEKGYVLNGQVIRHAKVVVSK